MTDVGSVKAAVVRDVGPHVPDGVHFVPGHPIAGTEQSGPEAGFAELFDNRWCILTPGRDTDPERSPGSSASGGGSAHVEIMTAEHHDLVLAITSHVPHLIAYNIVNTAAHLEQVTDKEVIKFSAGGFARLHAHRGLRPRDVARRVPQQPRGGARDAGPVLGGPHRPAARDPVRRRRDAAAAVRAGARRAPRHHPGRPGHRGARRPQPGGAGRSRRDPGPACRRGAGEAG